MGAAHSCTSTGAQLLTAVANGDNSLALAILDRHPRAACYSTCGDNTSPLLVAAGRGNHRLVQLILEAAVLAEGVERAKSHCINHTNQLGQTALMLACMQGHHAVVEYLINNGATPLVYDHMRQNTCLHWAANYSRAESVQRLLSSRATYQLNNGARVAVADIPCYDADGVRRIHFINRHNGWGLTALHLATHKGSISTVHMLLRNGALLDCTTTMARRSGGPTHIPPGSNVLHIAAAAADVGMVRLILETQLATGGPDLRGLINRAGKKPLDMLPPLRNHNSLLRHLLRDWLSIFVTQQLLARMQLALERTDGAGGGSHGSGGHALMPLLKRLNLVLGLELAAVRNQLDIMQGLTKAGRKSSCRSSSSSSSSSSSGCAGHQDAESGPPVEWAADCSCDEAELQALGFEPATSSSTAAWHSSSCGNVTGADDAAGDTCHHTAEHELRGRLCLLQELQKDAARALQVLVSAAAAADVEATQDAAAGAATARPAAAAAAAVQEAVAASEAATSSSTAAGTAGLSPSETQPQQEQLSAPAGAPEATAGAGFGDAASTPPPARAAAAVPAVLGAAGLALDGLPDLLRLAPHGVSTLYYAVKAVVTSSSLSSKQRDAAAAARAQLQQSVSAAAKNDVMWMQVVGVAPAVWVEQQQQLQHLRTRLQAVLQHLEGTHPSLVSLQSQSEVTPGGDAGDAWEGPWVSLRLHPSSGSTRELTGQTPGQTAAERVDQVLQRMPGGDTAAAGRYDQGNAPDGLHWTGMRQTASTLDASAGGADGAPTPTPTAAAHRAQPPAAAVAAAAEDVDAPFKSDQAGCAAADAVAAAKPCRGAAAAVPVVVGQDGGTSGAGGSSGAGDVCSSSDDTEAGTCSICMDRVVSLHMSSCSHGMCLQCAYQLCGNGRTAPLCPFCRQPIEGFAGLL